MLDAAAAIADPDGPASVSLATVAAALGVRSRSLYSSIDGLDGLRQALRRRASLQWGRRLGAAEGQADPVAALRGIGTRIAASPDKHPPVERDRRSTVQNTDSIERPLRRRWHGSRRPARHTQGATMSKPSPNSTATRAVVISGASSGIGRACALHLDRLGFHVFAGVRRAADGEALTRVTIYRWVQRFTPLLADAARFARHSPGDRW